jgi:hypothetical protein
LNVDAQRLLQHAVPLLLLAVAICVYLYVMGIHLTTKKTDPPASIIEAFAATGRTDLIRATRPQPGMLFAKALLALIPFGWWAAVANAPTSTWWVLSSVLAIAILAPPVLFPYLDVAYERETAIQRFNRWVGKLFDVALKKWTFALAVAWTFAMFDWHPSRLFMPHWPASVVPPIGADVVALTAILAVYLRGVFVAHALRHGPGTALMLLLPVFFVVGALFLLGTTLSPEGSFFLSVVGLGLGGGLLISLVEGLTAK